MTVTVMMGIPAVIPLIPLLPSLFAICGWLLLTLFALVTAVRNRERFHLLLRFLWRQRIGVATYAAGVFGVCLLLSGEADHPRNESVELPPRPSVDWPEYRGGPARTGALPGSRGPAAGEFLWTAATGYTFYSSPAVDGDRVYASGFQRNVGRIFCWNAATGELLWTVTPPRYQASVSSPVLAGDLLLIGEGLHSTTRGRVLALDLRAGHEGETVWEFETRGHVESTPTVRQDRVFVAAGDDGIYCLQTDRSVAPEERVVWHVSGSRYPDAEASLAVVGDRVLAGLGRGGNAVCLLRADTGEEIARRKTLHPVFGAPAVDGTRVVFGTAEGDYRSSGSGPGQVWCLDAQTLEPIWTRDVDSSVLDALAIQNGLVYCGTGDGRVLVFNLQDGAVQAKHGVPGAIVTAPAVSSRYLFVITENALLVCCRAKPLFPAWSARLPDAGQCFSSVTVAGERLFVGTSNGFFAVGFRKSPVAEP